MAQSFISTYRNHYRWNDIDRAKLTKPFDPFQNFPQTLQNVIINQEQDQSKLLLNEGEDIDKLIHKLYTKRYWSTYQIDYCKDMIKKMKSGEKEIQNTFENQLLEYSKNLYEPDVRPIATPPLPGTRKIFGYIAPRRLYTPLTNYQITIGRIPYDILMKNEKNAKLKKQETSTNENQQQIQNSTVENNQHTDKENNKNPKDINLNKLKCMCVCKKI